MKNAAINPVMVTVVVVVVLALAGGIWYFATNGTGGKPGSGQAGGADPMLSGPNNILQRGQKRPAQRNPFGR